MIKIGIPAPTNINGDSSIYEDLMESSFYTINLHACHPSVKMGPQLYKLVDASPQYQTRLQKILQEVANECGADYSPIKMSWPIQIHAIVDTPISEQFNNQYDESFVSRLANAVGGGISELRQTLGVRNMAELNQMIQKAKQGNKNMVAGLGLSLAGSVVEAGKQLEGWLRAHNAKALANLFLGHKIEFPKVWKDSNYATSYTFTIRIYNPNPGDINATFKHVVTPLCMLLMFVVPYSDDGFTYDWPFFCKAFAPGLFRLKYGAIADVSVVKGGDVIAIGFNQIPAIVDVRVTIIDLFSTMLGGDGQQTNIVDYLATMATPREVKGFEYLLSKQTSVSSTAINQAKNPTTTLPSVATEANNELVSQAVNDYLKSALPPSISNPSDDFLNDLNNITKQPKVQSLLRDYERGLTMLKNSPILNTLMNKSKATPTLLHELKTKTVVLKQAAKSKLVKTLLNNPTDSTLMNKMLRDIAIKASSNPNPDEVVKSNILHLQSDSLRPYAKRQVTNTMLPDVKLRVTEDYPNVSDGDTKVVASKLADRSLDECEKKVFGRTVGH